MLLHLCSELDGAFTEQNDNNSEVDLVVLEIMIVQEQGISYLDEKTGNHPELNNFEI